MTLTERCGDLPLMNDACFTIETCKIGDPFRLKDLNIEWAGARGHDFTIMMSDRQSGESA